MIEAILPASVAAAEAFGDDSALPPQASLFPEELAIIAMAGERRRREFVTARGCAHLALARLGLPPAPVPCDPRGAPRWPAGVCGAITHCAGYRAAAVALTSDVVSLGVDAAPDSALPDADMLGMIAREAERVRLRGLAAGLPDVSWDRLLFSAKESVYKAWYPLAECWLDFDAADVVFDDQGSFTARLLVPGPLVAGRPLTVLHGKWLAGNGLLLTAVVLSAR